MNLHYVCMMDICQTNNKNARTALPFLCLLKTSVNERFFWPFQGVKKWSCRFGVFSVTLNTFRSLLCNARPEKFATVKVPFLGGRLGTIPPFSFKVFLIFFKHKSNVASRGASRFVRLIRLDIHKQSFADVLKNFVNFTGKHLWWSNRGVFSREFCEIFMQILFYRTPPVAVSVLSVVNQTCAKISCRAKIWPTLSYSYCWLRIFISLNLLKCKEKRFSFLFILRGVAKV